MRLLTMRLAAVCAATCLATLDSALGADPVLPPISQRLAEADSEEIPSFQRHVGPLFGKLGCNGRACHGSFQGQGGFRLSLFGYDFDADHQALLDAESLRVQPGDPLASLILVKPTDADQHEGGKRYDRDGWEHRLLRQWIEAGALHDSAKIDRLRELRVEPAEIIFTEPGQSVQLRVVARWEDGTEEDVTPLCRFQSNDDAVASVDEHGQVTSHDPGDSHVVTFYDKGVQPVAVMLPADNSAFGAYPDIPASTRVDALVLEKLRKVGIVPSDVCGDDEFLRRVSLDLTGTLPAVAEVREFLADKRPDKRALKIDQLLETPAYAAWWATKLCDFTGNNSEQLVNVTLPPNNAPQQWYDWIHRRVADNAPYDELVEGIVLAVSKQPDQSYAEYCEQMSEMHRDGGMSFADREGLTHYWARRDFRMPAERAISFAHAFLGTRIQCAQCHKHPFDQWSKQDFDEFSPFFATVRLGANGAPQDRREYTEMIKEKGLEEKRGNELRRELQKRLQQGEVVPFPVVYAAPPQPRNVRQGRPQAARGGGGVDARVLGGEKISIARMRDPRQPLMQWLRDPENPYFARAFVNRAWASYFHVGIVEPADNLSLANPPSNEALLDHLAQGFIQSGFDMKWVHREILGSDAYQRSWKPNATNAHDLRNFSRAVPRRLPAEVMVDAIAAAAMSDAKSQRFRVDLEGRAIATAGTNRNGRGAYALTVFGRSTRDSNCDCDRAMEPSLLQTVYLQNDNEILAKINARDGWLAEVAGVEPARGPQNRGPQNRGPSLEELQQSLAAARRRGRESRLAGDLQAAQQADRQLRRIRAQIVAMQGRGAAMADQNAQDGASATDQMQDLSRDDAPSEQAAPAAASAPNPPGPRQPEPRSNPFQARQAELIDEAYLRTLTRLPSPEEKQRAMEHLGDAERPSDGLRDLLWVLINTKEFIVNH